MSIHWNSGERIDLLYLLQMGLLQTSRLAYVNTCDNLHYLRITKEGIHIRMHIMGNKAFVLHGLRFFLLQKIDIYIYICIVWIIKSRYLFIFVLSAKYNTVTTTRVASLLGHTDWSYSVVLSRLTNMLSFSPLVKQIHPLPLFQ